MFYNIHTRQGMHTGYGTYPYQARDAYWIWDISILGRGCILDMGHIHTRQGMHTRYRTYPYQAGDAYWIQDIAIPGRDCIVDIEQDKRIEKH